MFAWFSRHQKHKEGGFTLIELVVVLAIIGILISLAVPRYLSVRKRAYKAEADNILQEAKTLEWAYYQQYNQFDTAGTQIGLVTPGGMHWASPSFSGTPNASIVVTMSGAVSPLGATDLISIVLNADGSASAGSTF